MNGPNNWSAGDKVAKIPPIDNINRKYSRINRIKKKILNIETEKQLRNWKTSRGPCRGRYVPNNAKKVPQKSRWTVPLSETNWLCLLEWRYGALFNSPLYTDTCIDFLESATSRKSIFAHLGREAILQVKGDSGLSYSATDEITVSRLTQT
jgi:hypothetical protein